MIIGLTGKKQSGKTTLARYLVETRDFVEVSFADPIRDILYMMCILPDGFEYSTDKENIDVMLREKGHVKYVASQMEKELGYPNSGLADFVNDRFGLGFFSAREFMQKVGTQWGRHLVSESIWIDYAFDNLPNGKNFVFSDVRFDSEAEQIKKNDGVIVYIERSDYEHPEDDHETEWGVELWDYVVEASNVEDLKEEMDNLLDNNL